MFRYNEDCLIINPIQPCEKGNPWLFKQPPISEQSIYKTNYNFISTDKLISGVWHIHHQIWPVKRFLPELSSINSFTKQIVAKARVQDISQKYCLRTSIADSKHILVELTTYWHETAMTELLRRVCRHQSCSVAGNSPATDYHRQLLSFMQLR